MTNTARSGVVPRVLVLKEHGTNCEYESRCAFELAGAKADIVHMEDLIASRELKAMLKHYQILMLPGGFSYGDDTGSANAWANRIRNHLWDELLEFVHKDKLVLGICNGFQALVNLGLLPAINRNYGKREVALTHNDSARYNCRWVDLKFEDTGSPWTKGLDTLFLPIAHGEGKLYTSTTTLSVLQQKNLVAARYVEGEICFYQCLPANPNGSLDDIAGLCDESGRIFGMMPHPERAIFFTQLPHWTLIREQLKREGNKCPEHGPGIKIFENAINYFQ